MSEDMQACGASGIIRELRQRGLLVPAGEIRTRAAVVPSGIAKLDGLCGGLPAGGITEILVQGSGAAGILYALLAAATSRGESAAVIDPRDGFEASSATSACVNLPSLLWVRARGRRQALHACEIALASGAFGMVVLDMGPGRGRGPVSTRFRRVCREKMPASCVSILVALPISIPRSTSWARRCCSRPSGSACLPGSASGPAAWWPNWPLAPLIVYRLFPGEKSALSWTRCR